jgi:hypothetical protein
MANNRISLLLKQLEDRTRFVAHIVENIQSMSKLTDIAIRQYLNNERLNLGFEYKRFLLNKEGWRGAKVIRVFAEQGDPLCRLLEKYAEEHRSPTFIFNKIGLKLLTRMMTEQEYSDYLSGRKPISTYQGEHYLSKKDQIMTF